MVPHAPFLRRRPSGSRGLEGIGRHRPRPEICGLIEFIECIETEERQLNIQRQVLSGSEGSGDWLSSSERGLAALLLVLLLGLHGLLLMHAGGLWRDEVNTVQVANLPGLGAVWENLQYDSFPILWFLLLRAWALVGGGGDGSYRLLGFLVGLGIVGGLLWNARRLNISVPLISLLLLAFNPAVIRYGDSMRAYGLGIVLFLVMFGVVWKVATAPTRRNVIVATIVAVLCVQTLYYNAVLLLALCAGGAAVAMRHRQWPRIGLLLGVGLVAAGSLLPYVKVISAAATWNDMVRITDFDLAWFWEKLTQTTGASGEGMAAVWVGLVCVGVATGIGAQIRPQWLRATPAQKDLGLFCVTALVVGLAAYFIFLKILSYPTQPWYYVALLALVAITLEGLFSLLANRRAGRVLRLLVVLVAVMLTFRSTAEQAHQRHSNLDLIAGHLARQAAREDFIVVAPWYLGISFGYYYKNATPWMTLPPIGDHTVHRYDLVKEQMLLPGRADAVQPLLRRLDATLMAGHRVWMVGVANFASAGEASPGAGQTQDSLSEADYFALWSRQVGLHIQRRATRVDVIAVPVDGPLGNYENAPLYRVEGWRGD